MDTAKSPSWMVFYPRRTDLSVITASSLPVVIDTLYSGFRVTDMSAVESVSMIRSFMHSSTRITAARKLRGKEAQGLIDLIDQVRGMRLRRDGVRETEHGRQALALPELDGNLRRQCLHLLYKICKASELLPASYVLREERICVGNIRRYGGFADVSEGEYFGRRVAVKHLRFGTEEAFNKNFKVLKP